MASTEGLERHTSQKEGSGWFWVIGLGSGTSYRANYFTEIGHIFGAPRGRSICVSKSILMGKLVGGVKPILERPRSGLALASASALGLALDVTGEVSVDNVSGGTWARVLLLRYLSLTLIGMGYGSSSIL